MKAAGGIKSFEDAEEFISLARIAWEPAGSSSWPRRKGGVGMDRQKLIQTAIDGLPNPMPLIHISMSR